MGDLLWDPNTFFHLKQRRKGSRGLYKVRSERHFSNRSAHFPFPCFLAEGLWTFKCNIIAVMVSALPHSIKYIDDLHLGAPYSYS
jgi:hypothetical protein